MSVSGQPFATAALSKRRVRSSETLQGKHYDDGCHAATTSVTRINAMPAPNSSRCGWLNACHIALGGHRMVASRTASMQARTPDTNPTAVVRRRVLLELMSAFRGSIPATKLSTLAPARSRMFCLLKRVDSGYALPDDQGMHVVRAFVSLY
jgi:hypothetical protein